LSQTPSEQISTDEFVRTPYLNILTYPSPNLRIAASRLRQLKKIGVERIVFDGRTKVGRLGLLGIGTVGVVVQARIGESIYALKVRRLDANRESMLKEFELTQLANRVGVGPHAYTATKDFMLMQCIKGVELDQYIRALKGRGTRESVRRVVHLLLNQCRKLDLLDLDHGQLSDLRKHVVVQGDFPYIIDFESASRERTPKNVTTAAQHLFIGGRSSSFIRRLVGVSEPDEILERLKAYKRERSDENYVRLLGSVGIVS
jgi:putative serine/threonine protein kinase